MNLCNLTEVRMLLDRYGLAPKKGFGQNFLIRSTVPQEISASARHLAPTDKPAGVLEIGPGVGALTQYLCADFDRVVCVEIDHGLIPLLGEVFVDTDNVTVVEADFMQLDLPTFLTTHFGDMLSSGGTISICANLPYYITTPVLMKILESWNPLEPVPLAGITIMIQLEVARRICAVETDKEYGAITAAVGLKAHAHRVLDVSAGNFYPVPKVDSAVCAIVPHGGIRTVYPALPDDPVFAAHFAKTVPEIIGLAFGQRRKTLTNSLSARFPKEKTSAALQKMGLREDIRGEKLSAADFCSLTAHLLEES